MPETTNRPCAASKAIRLHTPYSPAHGRMQTARSRTLLLHELSGDAPHDETGACGSGGDTGSEEDRLLALHLGDLRTHLIGTAI